jgi:hypothetical protein
MRKRRGKWTCKQCGVVLDVPDGRRPDVMIAGESGRPNVRILSVDGREIHRCEIS